MEERIRAEISQRTQGHMLESSRQHVYVASTVNTQYKPGLQDGRAGKARFRAPSAVAELPLAVAKKASDAVIVVMCLCPYLFLYWI